MFENFIYFFIYWLHQRYLDGYDLCSSSNFFKRINELLKDCDLTKIVSELKPDLFSKTCQTNTVVQNAWQQTQELLWD